ncbi:MAG: carboxypeptidase regulatory-like domain-containing protein [Chitinispirillaceae bacterium]|nr:carboxypeptidase regulatory-like domain-containing protein [Chitinispirillaceae bacterium]
MNRIFQIVFLTLICIVTSGQSMNLSGKVLNANSKPVRNAIVTLVGQNIKDTTDVSGAYSFVTTAVYRAVPLRFDGEGISFLNGFVSIKMAQSSPVHVEIYTINGKFLHRLDGHCASKAEVKCDLRSFAAASSALIIRVTAGQREVTYRYITNNNSEVVSAPVVRSSSSIKVPGFFAVSSAVDSLKVTASGYYTTSKPISSFEGKYDITIDTMNLPKFSFFATSLAGIQRLSKKTEGFGGDLRFGKTGPGAGLMGADSICQCLAEESMPGSKVKVWRAFLSVTKDASGKKVNAIDRIGKGPWYDRLERVVAMNIADLQHPRPKADDDIIDDLPNEDGVPNHRPDPNKPFIDNHQFITGSDTLGRLYSENATCQDWTSSTDTDSKPRCGLSYPRRGFAMGVGSDPWAEWDGNMTSWISVWNLWGCKPGIDLSEASMRGVKGNYTIGNGGGYGGFYCFALNP